MQVNNPKPSTFSRQTARDSTTSIPSLPRRSEFIKDHPKAFKAEPKISHRNQIDLTLYRNLIPSEPINIIKGLQHRHQTLEIFKGFGDRDYVPDKLTKSKNGVNNQISKNDSADRVKFLIERAKKDDDNNYYKKHKTRGTMYINELWGHKYEEKTIRAASINKDIAVKEKNSWKPLQQHMEDLVTLYDKRHKKNYALPTTSKIVALEDVSTPSMVLLREASRSSDKRPTTKSLKVQTDTFTESVLEVGETASTTAVFPVRHSSLPNVIRKITRNEVESQVGSLIGKNKEFSQVDFDESTTDLNSKIMDKTASRHFFGTNIMSSMPPSPKSSRYDRSFLVHASSLPSSPLIKKKIDLQKGNLSKSSFLIKSVNGSHLRTSSQPNYSILSEVPAKKQFVHHKNDSLNGLIEKCNSELEDRPQLISTMAHMEKLFLTAKYDKKIRLEQNFRQKTIENCQDLFRLRLESKKKMP